VLGGAVGQARVLPQEQGGQEAGGVVSGAGVLAQAAWHDPARDGHCQPREKEGFVVHDGPDVGITTSGQETFDRATLPQPFPTPVTRSRSTGDLSGLPC
jgi:hypothetical protein